jgi:hypothetical protein
MELWQAVATQWRASACGLLGLDYVAVKIVADAIGVELSADVLEKLQILEGMMLERQAQQSGKNSNG